MSFKCRVESPWGFSRCDQLPARWAQHPAQQQFFHHDLVEKIKNSICFILQVCDSESLHRSTKFLAYSLLTQYLKTHTCPGDEDLEALVVCSLRLAAKFNEADSKATVFESENFCLSVLPTRKMEDIFELELSLFRELGFKIYVQSPYEILDELALGKGVSVGFYNSVTSFIDFALTIVEMIPFTPEQITTACLIAAQTTRMTESKQMWKIIGEKSKTDSRANQASLIILNTWESIIKEQSSTVSRSPTPQPSYFN